MLKNVHCGCITMDFNELYYVITEDRKIYPGVQPRSIRAHLISNEMEIDLYMCTQLKGTNARDHCRIYIYIYVYMIVQDVSYILYHTSIDRIVCVIHYVT